jgi:hypothetical protein
MSLDRQAVLYGIVGTPSHQLHQYCRPERGAQSRHPRTNRGGGGITGPDVHDELPIAGTKERLEYFSRALNDCAADHVEWDGARGDHRETVGIYASGGKIAECDARLARA